MNVDPGLLRGLFTALMLVLFTGICVWAYSGKQRGTFEEAARRPLERDDTPPTGPTPRP